MLRLAPGLLKTFAERFSFKTVVSLLQSDANIRLVQSLITISNEFLVFGEPPQVDSFVSGEMEGLIPQLVHFLDSQSQVVKSKAMLTLTLGFRKNILLFGKMPEMKFVGAFDKLVKSAESSKYLTAILNNFGVLISEAFPSLLKNLTDKLAETTQAPASMKPNLTSYSQNILSILVLITSSPSLRSLVLSDSRLNELFAAFFKIEKAVSKSNSDDFSQSLLKIFENISNSTKLNSMTPSLLSDHLPDLISQYQSSKSDHMRFIMVKVLTDFVGALNMDLIRSDPRLTALFGSLSKIIVESHLKEILADKDPLPIYGLRLVHLLGIKCYSGLTNVKKISFIGILMDFFSPGHPKLNTNVLEMMAALLESGEVTLAQVGNLSLVPKALALLKKFSSERKEWGYSGICEVISRILGLKMIELSWVSSIASSRVDAAQQAVQSDWSGSKLGANDGVSVLLGGIQALLEIIKNSQVDESSSDCLLLYTMIFGGSKEMISALKPEILGGILEKSIESSQTNACQLIALTCAVYLKHSSSDSRKSILVCFNPEWIGQMSR